MKIISITNNDPFIGAFEACIKFSMINDRVDLVAADISHDFKRNFVLLELASRIYAGGASDNALSWEENWQNDSVFSPTGIFELRCYASDLTFFMLKYNIPRNLLDNE